jgi:hypothetical protein
MSFSLAGNKITIEQGSTYSLTMNWTDSNGDTIPLVTDTWTARMKGREDKESSTEVFSWTSGAELILSDSNPNIRIEVEASATAAYTAPLLGWYDLELVDATSNVYKIISGVLQIDREVTR